MKNKKLFASLVFLVALFFLFTIESRADDSVSGKRTLNRWADPIIMEGSLLKDLIGSPISNLRVYAFRNGTFEPIRFQIDEMTGENGDWILPEGPLPNNKLSNGTFDTWDTLLFLADDMGDRVSKESWVTGYTKGTEIKVTDPVTGERGWCYMFSFASNPPAKSSKPNYVRYDYENETIESDCYHIECIITEDGRHSTFYKCLYGPKWACGNEKNFTDRLKVRATAKVMFGSLSITFNEEQLKSDTVAYKRRPVRVTRRVEQYARIPGGIKALRGVIDLMYYRHGATVPVIFDIPFKLDTALSSLVVRFGTDYGPAVLGSMTYNSNNTQGFPVDGKMDDGEKNFNPKVDTWRLITGDFGTFMTRTIFTPELLKDIKITMGLIDDITYSHSPEAYPGCIGYLYQDWDITHLKRGKYHLFVELYGVPCYKRGDEVKFMNYIDNPLKIQVGDQEMKNNTLMLPNLGDQYRKTFKKKYVKD